MTPQKPRKGTARLPGSHSRSRELTPERARQKLIEKGFDPAELDSLLKLFKRVEKGDYFFPVTWNQAVRGSQRYIKGLIKQLESLADEWDGVWREKGIRLLGELGDDKIRASLPAHLRRCSLILSVVLKHGGAKLPTAKKEAKLYLIQRAKELTGAWRDAELAALCGDNTENWKMWRKTWFKPEPILSPPPTS